jgi:3-deoxy-D-manno-octulosonic-acid transferase
MYLLYSLLFGGLLLAGLPYLVFRCFREPGYARALVARFRTPSVPPSNQPTIWIHAVSVGEVIAAETLLPELERALPDARFVVSVITVTGRRVAAAKLGDRATVFYCPFDLGFVVRKAVRAVRPRALVVVETEIWPHLLRETRRAGAVTMIAGGRISDRSFPRYRAIRPFMKRFLEPVDRLCMQNELYAERITALGAPEERVQVTGSLKFDAIAPLVAGGERAFPENRRILIAGSTLDPEEDAVLQVFESLSRAFADLFLVIAPRHPPRFDEIAALIRRRGHRLVRRSSCDGDVEAADVMLLDTLGELASLYEQADYVFVGGSLADWGGHNIIEPASKGRPVVFGPYMRNFADIARLFVESDAAVQVDDVDGLESVVREWLDHPERPAALANNATKVIDANRGASHRTAAALKELIG